MRSARPWLPFGGFAAAVVGVHLLLRATGTEYCLTQLTMALYYALVVLGLSLVMGFAGQVSLGHGAFFALGGYTAAVLTTCDLSHSEGAWVSWLTRAHVLVAREDLYGHSLLSVAPGAAFLAAMLLSALVAGLLGYPALRLRGHYLAMATLGFGVIVNKFLLANSWTGAADGINGVPPWRLPGGLTVSGKGPLRVENYYLAAGLVVLALLLLRNLVRSRMGRALQAIHDGETVANALGIDTARCKLKVFVASALLAALAGVFFTHYTGGIAPSEAGPLKSVRYVALAAAGGLANLWGVAVMSTALNYCSLRGWFGTYDNAVFGAALILLVSLAPEGPIKPLGLWLRRLWLACEPARETSEGRKGLDRALDLSGALSPGAPETLLSGAGAPARPGGRRAGRPWPETAPGPGALGAEPDSPREGRPPAELLASGVPLLQATNLRRRFGGVVAVDGLSFQVQTGQIKAVIGPNGAGKTTLFNLITGLVRPEAGAVAVGGQLLKGLAPWRIARLGLARTFQSPSLFWRLSVLENVMVGRHGRSRAGFCACALRAPVQRREESALRQAALAELEYVGLADLAARPAGALAFGHRRLVELARALASEPALLLLDEPASGLNTREKEDLAELLRRIRQRGLTILLVEHDMSLVMGLSDEILVLHNGALIAEGAPRVVQNDPRVLAVYLGAEPPAVGFDSSRDALLATRGPGFGPVPLAAEL